MFMTKKVEEPVQKWKRKPVMCVWCGGTMRENETGYQCCGVTVRKKFNVPVDLSTMPEPEFVVSTCGL